MGPVPLVRLFSDFSLDTVDFTVKNLACVKNLALILPRHLSKVFLAPAKIRISGRQGRQHGETQSRHIEPT